MSEEIVHTVEREFKRLGAHVRVLHVPGLPSPYFCLVDLPGASERDTRCTITNSFAVANKEYDRWVKIVKEI